MALSYLIEFDSIQSVYLHAQSTAQGLLQK